MAEGSFRAIAWRALLEYIPTKDISNSWRQELPPQRAVYESFVDDYFIRQSALDPGRELRGNHSKKLTSQHSSDQYEKVQRLDYESDDSDENDSDDDHESGQEGGIRRKSNSSTALNHEDSNGSLVVVVPEEEQNAAEKEHLGGVCLPVLELLMDQLPPRFKDQWKKSGMSIATSKNTQATNLALGINKFFIPQLVLDYTSTSTTSTSTTTCTTDNDDQEKKKMRTDKTVLRIRLTMTMTTPRRLLMP
jgi:hypothetical protein